MSFGVAANTAASASHITQNLASTSHITEDLQADILQLDSAATGIKESVEALEKVASKNLPQSPSLTIQEAGADLQGMCILSSDSTHITFSIIHMIKVYMISSWLLIYTQNLFKFYWVQYFANLDRYSRQRLRIMLNSAQDTHIFQINAILKKFPRFCRSKMSDIFRKMLKQEQVKILHEER